MTAHYAAPHKGGTAPVHQATNAALLIDFDNVTMGIRSDLTKELKSLLNSDIIKGKVAVQRAYADWRRYPQYIVPLSEGSVDLIFAPAYGSSKKNATDIRLAIDALELVFTRPEIGTFILLSGDSDFSSLVLKLKEYGKYVIGVGIKESSSDLLVQNCDEYYSYNALTGLTRAGEEEQGDRMDPWDLVQAAVERMAENDDVMRSDRLKQVMIEMDEGFDEKGMGFSKYNRFLSEAATKGRIKLRKLENGQYEVAPAEGRRAPSRSTSRSGGAAASQPAGRTTAVPSTPTGAMTLDAAYQLLQRAVRELAGPGGGSVRDSDVKRQMLELRADWDEAEVGFSKFSHFLRQAHNSEIIDLQRTSEGLYEVVLPGGVDTSDEPAAIAENASDADSVDSRSARMERGARPSRGDRPANGRRGRRGGREREDREEREPRSRGGRGRGGRDRTSESDAEPRVSGAEATSAAPLREEQTPEATPEPRRTSATPAPTEAPPAQAERADAAAPTGQPSAAPAAPAATSPSTPTPTPPAGLGRGRRGPRRGAPEGPPPLLPGQTVDLGGGRTAQSPAASTPAASASASQAATTGEDAAPSAGTPAARAPRATGPMPSLEGVLDPKQLGLPTEAGAVVRYLTNRYRGVGDKTAEQLVEVFGAEYVFAALQVAPDRVAELVGAHRAAALLEAWEQDYSRRAGTEDEDESTPPARESRSDRYTRESNAAARSGGTATAPTEATEADVPKERTTATEADVPNEPTNATQAGAPNESAAATDSSDDDTGIGFPGSMNEEREVLASDVEREAPDLWSNPREPRGE